MGAPRGSGRWGAEPESAGAREEARGRGVRVAEGRDANE